MNTSLIDERMAAVERYAEEHFLDGDGIVYSELDSSTGRPPTQETFRGNSGQEWGDWHVDGFTKPEYAAYENCGMCTGSYISALIAKYQLTRDASILPRIRHSIQGIFHIAEIGRQLGYGYLPKIYGGRFSVQTSTDQYLSELNALDEFRRLPECTPDEKKAIEGLIVAAVEFWRKRKYRYTYFIYENMLWPITRFIPFLMLAYNVTGDETYRKEADELTTQNIWLIPECTRFRPRELNDWERQNKKFFIWSLPDACSMESLNSIVYLRNAPELYKPIWQRNLMDLWLQGAKTIQEDGTCGTTMTVDMQDGSIRMSLNEGSDGKVTGYRTGWSSMILRCGLLAARENPGFLPEVLPLAKRILESYDAPWKMSYIDPRDAELLPANYRFKSRFISGDAMSNALWSYWLLKGLLA